MEEKTSRATEMMVGKIMIARTIPPASTV